ncbi:uncharacterized protein LOC1280411 [Anopheles gambiae]|uniref:Peptidase S1 domain-containing protein n=2 Tax=Anopheles gambiae TaxID=7165 RepID=A0A2C9H402_ANOGA|nr:uncharacterized protein LOC1280411 [Anopheles gambiae]
MRCPLKRFLLVLALLYLVPHTCGQEENHLTCGRRKVKTQYYIHNGVDARAGHWPWHATIYHKNKYACGGSIIDESTILTASHCVYLDSGVISKTRVSVHVGRINLNESSEHTQTFDVRDIIVHPGFSKRSIINDIALIKLSSNITMTKYVQPVCLWTMDSKLDTIMGRNGTIVGFGSNEHNVVSDQLKQALIGVMDPLTCIATDRNVFGTHLTSDMFCGKGQTGVSACNGDSGGGMFFETNGKWYVRGLVSFSPERGNTTLCDPLKPTAYTDVAKYLNWIKRYIDQRVLSYDSDVLDIDYEEKLRLFNFKTCGVKVSKVDNYNTSWTLPWVGYVTSQHENKHRCVVTLISDWYAVGPADCFENNGVDAYVLLGYGLESPDAECFVKNGSTLCHHPSQQRRIKNFIIHPKFDRTNDVNNIALIELLTPADTSQVNVKPICVPVTSELRTNAKRNLHVAVLSSTGNSLKTVPIRYVESVECRRQYADSKLALNLENSFCTEIANKQDAQHCFSMTEGTPLHEIRMINGVERYFLRGFKLLGSICDSKALPTVFSNAEAYLDWILYNMKYNTLEPTNAFRIATVNTTEQTLESEWSKLQQQPGKENLRLFNMDTCGLTSTRNQNLGQMAVMPWIGFFDAIENSTDESPSTRSLAVLISEWYALVPKSSVQNGATWRYLVLGKFNPDVPCFPPTCVPTYQEVDIKNVILPPADESKQIFALIELLEPADLTNPYIKPICLPFMDQLYRNKPTEVVVSSASSNSYAIESKKLTMVDKPTCRQRLMREGFLPPSEGNPSCAIEADKFKQTKMSLAMGSPFQMAVGYGGRTRYFLYGMNFQIRDTYEELVYGPYLFDAVVMSDLEWVLANMQEKEQQTSFQSATRNERVNLRPVQYDSKRTLFNFNTCGISSRRDPTPWMGYVFSNAPFFNESRCSATLISDWYVISAADCFEDPSADHIIQFGDYMDVQQIATQKIFVHPRYNRTNHYNDIALALLRSSVDTSASSIKPICLPTINQIRSYDTLSLILVGHTSTSDSEYRITNINGRYIDMAECQKRWQGLKVSYTIDRSTHCVITKRTTDDECVGLFTGASLHSLQLLRSKHRQFLRGFTVTAPKACSIYYPAIYTNTDAYLDWILETMEQPAVQLNGRRHREQFRF